MIVKALRIVFATLMLLGISVPNARAEENLTAEYLVKAAFLYNFTKFVEWPAEAFNDNDAPIFLGILGDDPFGSAIKTIEGKTIKGRKLIIKRFSRVENLNECHILFICSSERKRLSQILDRVKSKNVLTVGETEEFVQTGGILSLVKDGKKIKFGVNLNAAREAGVKVSSKLLKLAKFVINGHKEEK